jgi:hypothetical protein
MTKAIANTKHTTIKQSDAVFAMTSAAAQREDRCLAPPPKLKPAVRRKGAEKLIEAGLVREVRAKPGMPVWRREEETGIEYSLKLTAAGARAGAIREGDDRDQQSPEARGPEQAARGAPEGLSDVKVSSHGGPPAPDSTAPPQSTVVSGGAGYVETSADPDEPSEQVSALSALPRPGSKIAKVLNLLGRNEGASLDEVIGVTGWLPHTARAAFTGLRHRGYGIERSREDATTRYRVLNASARDPSPEPQEQSAPDTVDNSLSQPIANATDPKARAKRKAAATERPSAP